MAYTMVIYQKNLSDGWTLPYVPEDSIEISADQSTDEFSSINRTYIVPALVSPLSFGWSGIWPSRAARWANPKSKASPHEFRAWVEKHRTARDFFHVVLTTETGVKLVNDDFTMPKFSMQPRRNGDFTVTMEFKRYDKVKKTTGSSSGSASSGSAGSSGTSYGSASSAMSGMLKQFYRVKIVNCTALYIRKGAGKKYSVTGVLKKGATAVISGESKDRKWLRLMNGKGYISKAYTKKVTT